MKRIFLLGICCMLLGSCVNELEKIKKVTISNTDPDERIKDLELLLTDSGYAKVRIFAKLAEMYGEPQNITKLKDSLCVYFYKEDGKIESILKGKYGEYLPDKKLIKIFNQVTLENVDLKQKMATEELIWKQADSSIYSNRLVTITSPTAIFYGDGIRSKQDFSSYEFIKPRGKITQ